MYSPATLAAFLTLTAVLTASILASVYLIIPSLYRLTERRTARRERK